MPTTLIALTVSAAIAAALAGSLLPPPEAVAASPTVVPEGGCHPNTQFHHVEAWGRAALHFHRVPDCAPVLAPL